MLVVETIAKIRRAHIVEGKSIKQICRQLVNDCFGRCGQQLGGNLIDKAKQTQILRCMAKYYDTPIDRTFFALADPTRRQVLERLTAEPGLSISELAEPLPIKMPGLMKHLSVLTDAGLISRTKSGRVVTVSLAARPLGEAADWLRHFEAFWNVSLDRLAAYVEEDDSK